MSEKQVSAGGIVLENREGEPFVLVGYTNYPRGRWTLPKGIIQEGETPEEAAVREVAEETGFVGKIEQKIGETHYTFRHEGVEYDKTVIYFLMSVVRILGKRDEELAEVRWVPLELAIQIVLFGNEKEILQQVKHLV